jgi:DNA invertase Pin-like site-specific DNA recombinase
MSEVIAAVTYSRPSITDQEQSIDRQREQVERYAAARAYRVAGEYMDEGIAGDVFDVIVVDDSSRRSR